MNMSGDHDTIENIMRDLAERAKELSCLYAVEELTSAADVSLEDVFRGVIKAVPDGWQYPGTCQARITYNGVRYGPADFPPTPWVQQATIRVHGELVGSIEVQYLEEMPAADEGPFLREERRLIDMIAERLGSCITHRWLLGAMKEWRSARQELARHTDRDWAVILDLLRRTDQNLLLRVARKMINHLCCSGVKEAGSLLQQCRGGPADVEVEANQPGRVDAVPAGDTLIDEAFRIAARRLLGKE